MIRAIVFLVLALSFSLKATTYYAGKNGSDSYTCEQAQNPATPKLTINGALACIGHGATDGAGHTIIVNSGTYDEFFDYDQGTSLPGGTSWNAPFTLKAAAGATVRLDPTSGACSGKACFNFTFYNRGYIIVDGIIVDGTHVAYDNIQFQCDGHESNCAHHIRFQNGELYNAFGSAVIGSGNVEYNELINMKIHAAGVRDLVYGHNTLYLTGSHWLIENCEIYDGETGGIMFWDQVGTPSYNTARGNFVHDMTTDGGNAVGIGMYKGPGNQAINNVIWNIKGQGITMRYGCSNCAALNNTIYRTLPDWDGEAYGIEVGAGCTNAMVKNNIAWSTTQSPLSNAGLGTIFANNLCESGANCAVTGNPLFVNAGGYDLKLQAASSAINAGTNLSLEGVIADKDGVARLQGGAYDIGAYEFTDGTVITSSLTVSATSVAPGGTITVTVTGGSNNPNQWVGVYSSTAPDADWGNCENCWKYLNGTQMIPSSAVTTPVTLTFTAPTDPGTYNFRLFPSDAADDKLAVSSNFTVTGTAEIAATHARSNTNLSATQVGNQLLLRAYFPTAGKYSLSVYDLRGKLRWSSSQQFAPVGGQKIDLAGMGKSLSNGLYLVSLTTRTEEIRTRIAVLK